MSDSPSPDRAHHGARLAAALTAAVLIAVAALGLSGDVSDHTHGLGAASEILAGVSFLTAAVTLILLRPVSGWRGALWWLAPIGLGISGCSMLMVPVVGAEPPDWLFVVGVVPCFVGLVAAGVLGIRRIWPWWVGIGVALQLPIMFLAPLNALWMALLWIAVVWSLGRRRSAPGLVGAQEPLERDRAVLPRQ